jgi:hypothetical protein
MHFITGLNSSPEIHFPTSCYLSDAAGHGYPGSSCPSPPPTARTPPSRPNFRKFGLGLPTSEQAWAQPRLPALLPVPDLHRSAAEDHRTMTRSPTSAPSPPAVRASGSRTAPAHSPPGRPEKGAPGSERPAPGVHLHPARTRPVSHLSGWAGATRSLARTPRAPAPGLPARPAVGAPRPARRLPGR